MNKILISFISSILFGLGLGISGMTLPTRVVGFLDFFGEWDPTLAFVMAGGIGVHLVIYRLIRKRNSPILSDVFSIPTKTDIDAKLIIGSTLFGIGWGIGGFCPGPAIASIASGTPIVLIFVVCMIAGMVLSQKTQKRLNL